MSALNLEKLSRLVVSPQGDIFDSKQQTNILVDNRLALQPDFFIFQFYPNEVKESFEIPFRQGNLIAFLNGFFPPSYNITNQPPYYLNTVRENDAITTNGIVKGKIVLAIPRMKWKFPYDRLYLYHRDGAFLNIDNAGTWTFELAKELTTPYFIFFGRDMDIDISGFESENSQRFGFSSLIPNSSATAAIDIYHGNVKKNIDFTFTINLLALTNTTRVVVKQIDHNGVEWIDYLNEVDHFPINETVTLPYRNSPHTLIQVLGGGGGESGTIKCVLELKE